MESQEEIIDLGPLIESPRVSFQFETPGWYMLAAIVAVVVVVFIIVGIRKYLKNAYRREAIRLLGAVEIRFREKQDVTCVNDVMILLKQVSLQTFSRGEVADLHGAKWLAFLDSKCKHASFVEFEPSISNALYKNEIGQSEDVLGVFKQSLNWIKHHA